MDLPCQALTDDLAVAPQLMPEAMAAAAAAGFRAWSTTARTSGAPEQPTSAAMQAAAEAAGLVYRFFAGERRLPVARRNRDDGRAAGDPATPHPGLLPLGCPQHPADRRQRCSADRLGLS